MNSKVIIAKNINIDKSYNNVLSYTENDMLSLINNANNKIAESNNCSFIKHNRTLYTDFKDYKESEIGIEPETVTSSSTSFIKSFLSIL